MKEKSTFRDCANNYLTHTSSTNGITLIALVVTIIIVLLILVAGVTITMVLRKDGIVAQEKLAEDIQNLEGEETGKPNPGGTPSSTGSENNLITDGSFDEEKGLNAPKLGTGMTAVKWDEESSSWVEPKTNDEWYDYDSKQWANAVTEKNGIKSYWVWIPRYAYRITSGYHQSGEDINSADGTKGAGTIEIKFLQGTENKDASGSTDNIVESLTEIVQSGTSGPSTKENEYVVHPAFTNNPENGGWNAELTGIWVAKYEASHSDAKIENGTITEGTSDTLSVRPSVTSWRDITVSESYDTCKAYDSTLNSHLMKNSEWGAVAYLAHSKYGLNRKEIGVNQYSNLITGDIIYITGVGPYTGDSNVYNLTYSYDAENFETTYGYKSTQGKKASTTGNEYGIYDMSGGSWEYVSAYLKDCSNENTDSLEKASTSEPWTVDLYEGKSDDSQTNYTANNNKYGDAVWETSIKPSGYYSEEGDAWFKDGTAFPDPIYPVFIRGGWHYEPNLCRFILLRQGICISR